MTVTIPGLSDTHIAQIDNVIELVRKILLHVIFPAVAAWVFYKQGTHFADVDGFWEGSRTIALSAGPVLVFYYALIHEPRKIIRRRSDDRLAIESHTDRRERTHRERERAAEQRKLSA